MNDRRVAARRNRPSAGLASGQRTAAFVVGCLMVAGLFATAVTGYLPAGLVSPVIKLCIAVAGGGFTMFLLGNVHGQLPNGLRIGGPMGVFVLLYLLTPASLIKEAISGNLSECESNLENAPSTAESFCRQAAADLPNEGRPLLLLGAAQSNLGKYREAIETWSRALKAGSNPALTHYNIAFARFQLGEHEEAIRAASTAAEEASGDNGTRDRAWYLIAEAERELWKDGKGDDVHFANARDRYLAFIERGYPTYRAEGNLACLFARKAALEKDEGQVAGLEDQAIAHFDKALASIKAYGGPNNTTEKLSFAAAFRPDGDSCSKALAELWAQKRPDENYESLVKSVQS